MFDRAHYLFTFGGTGVNGLEQWQTGIRFAPDLGTTEAQLLGELDKISVSDCFAAMSVIISQVDVNYVYSRTTVARFAKLAVIKQDGSYAGAPKIHEGSTPGKNTSDMIPPPQVAWVATLGTGKKFGMAQKGRMYWPPPINIGSLVDGLTGQVTLNFCTGFRDRLITAINAVEGEVATIDVAVSAAVMSKSGGVHAPTGPGTTNYVTELSMGRILDTQRRRRGELQEAYSPAPAAAGLRRGQLLGGSDRKPADGPS